MHGSHRHPKRRRRVLLMVRDPVRCAMTRRCCHCRVCWLQAGMYIWQLLFPNNKQGKQKREESIKLGIVEVGRQFGLSARPGRAVESLSAGRGAV